MKKKLKSFILTYFKSNKLITNSDSFTKLGEACKLDNTTGLFFINEAFTFESISTVDLNKFNAEIESVNYFSKEVIGKVMQNIIIINDFYMLN